MWIRRLILVLVFCGATLSSGWSQEMSDLDRFFRDVGDGRAERVEAALKEHPEWVNRELYLGIKPLYRASVLGRSEVVQLLLERGADPSETTQRGSLPVHAACQNGHLAVLMLLLAHKSPVDQANEQGQTPLQLAVTSKQAKSVEELVRQGATLNAVNPQGRTALHLAAGLGRMDLVAPLVEAGAELNLLDRYGYSPLGWARTRKRNSFGDVGGYLDARGAKDIRPDDTTDSE